MANTLLVVKVADILIGNPLAGERLNGAGFICICRHVMVGDNDNPVSVPDMPTEAFQHRFDPARPARIMDHCQIDFADHHITDGNGGSTGGLCDQFSGKSFHEKTVT